MKVICDNCSTEFERPTKEVNRIRKLGRKMYCSRVCTGGAMKGNNRNPNGNPDLLKASNRKDEYTGFRYHLHNMKKRTKEITITLQDLKEVWEAQNGTCPYTGWNLKLTATYDPRMASVDRIDNTKGYVKGNIQFVSVMVNYAKNGFTEAQLGEFIDSLVEVRIARSGLA